MKRLVALLVSSVLVFCTYMSGYATEHILPAEQGKAGQTEINKGITEPTSGFENQADIEEGLGSTAKPSLDLPIGVVIPTVTAVKVTSENVRFYGRRLESDTYIQAINSNSGIEARFIGTGLKLNINGPSLGANDIPFIQVWVDGKRTERIQISYGDKDYTVANNLAYGEHTVKVLLVTEIKNGASAALKFKTIQVLSQSEISGEAGLLPPIYDDDQLIIDFYGDSITAGYGTIPGYPEGFRTRDQDSSTTYAFRTAEYFNADANFHCRSGWSIYWSYGSNRGIIPRVWKYVGIEDERPWPVENRHADIVVVALGTNDAWTWEQDPESLFTTKYVNFLKDMRQSYPDAYFICVHGMMDVTFSKLVEDAAVEFSKTDPIGAKFVEMPNMNKDPSYAGSGGHPSGTFGEYASTFLIDAIENYYYKEWQYKLLCATDMLANIDVSGWYADLLETAYATAKDHNATGRNPKRLYSEVIDAYNELSEFFENSAFTAVTAAFIMASDYSESIKHNLMALTFDCLANIESSATKKDAEEKVNQLEQAIKAVKKGEGEEFFSGIDIPEGIIGYTKNYFSPDGAQKTCPSSGDTVSVELYNTYTAEQMENLTGSIKGDKFRSSKRGKILDMKNPTSFSEKNGVNLSLYQFEYKSGMENLKISDGTSEIVVDFEKPQIGNPEYYFATESLRTALSKINTTQAIKAVAEEAQGRMINVALVGSFTDEAAAHLTSLWDKTYGRNSVSVDLYPCNGIEACYYSDIIIKNDYDLVAVELSANETSSEAKQIYESVIRSILASDDAPAVICIGQDATKGAYDEHVEVAKYYNLPYINLNNIMNSSSSNVNEFKRQDGERSIIMDGVAAEAIALAVIGGVYADVNENVFPETPLTPAQFTNFRLLTPEDIEPTKLTNLVKQQNEDGDWVWYTETGKGTLKFNLENYECVAIIFKDLAGNNSCSIMGKFGGKNKANTFVYSPLDGKKAYLLYSGDVFSGENSITATFRGPAEIYGFLVRFASEETPAE